MSAVAADRVRFVPKGGTVLAPGDVAEGAALVLRGCLRLSFVESDGGEGGLSFAREGWRTLLSMPRGPVWHLLVAGVVEQTLLALQQRLLGSLQDRGGHEESGDGYSDELPPPQRG